MSGLTDFGECIYKLTEIKRERDQYKVECERLEQENNDLRLQADTYFDEWQTVKNLYTTLTNHIRQKTEANPNVDRYIALVNYIDRLERE
ncbi:hypothetical protein [Staphylococcus gallinarum]|uniref:hypothetical protein n=1 Tax=Staphylococcus gallinarum TaxID=1293 RepID=UPI003177C1D5